MSGDKKTDKNSKTVLVKIVLGVIALAVLIAWSGGLFKSKVSAGQLEVVTGRPVPEGSLTIQVKREMVAPLIDLVGTVASGEKILLSSRISAYVKRVYASAGDTVKENQLLVKLDNRDLKEQLADAEAQLNQAQSEYRRSLKLKEADATTDQALTAAKSAFESARARLLLRGAPRRRRCPATRSGEGWRSSSERWARAPSSPSMCGCPTPWPDRRRFLL